MADRKWINPVTIEGAEFHYRDFAGSKFGPTSRAIGIRLSKELADELAAEGWDVRVLEATEQYPDEKYYIPIKVKYGLDRKGIYRHPDVYQICGNVMTLLDEETVHRLDSAEIDNVDLTFTPNFNDDKITAYLSKMYVTIHQDHLSVKYEKYMTGNLAPIEEEFPTEY